MSMLTNLGKVAQFVVGKGPVMLLLVRNSHHNSDNPLKLSGMVPLKHLPLQRKDQANGFP